MNALREFGSVAPKRIWDGVLARIVESDAITMALVELDADSVVPEHRHENEQVGMVLEGSVTFTVGDETRELGTGGTWQIVADVPHHVETGPRGAVVVEVYTPVRRDWQQLQPDVDAIVRWPGGQ